MATLPTPERGSVIFHAACRPALTAGDYKLEVSHTIEGPGGALDAGASKPLPGPREFPFKLQAPRFTLDPSMIHAVFPPTNGVGSYVSRLPMIVLRRRTLPWERTLAAGDTTPWLAVLLLEKGEATTLSPCTVRDVLAGATGKTSPRLKLPDVPAAAQSQPCMGLELPLGLFQEIAPLRSEIPLLTHVRQVNTDDKELLGQDEDGWFSVVVGNRLPEPGKQYEACLVSLEGTQDFLPTEASTPVLTAADLRRTPLEIYTEALATMQGQVLFSEPDLTPEVQNQVLLDHMVSTGSAYKWSGVASKASPPLGARAAAVAVTAQPQPNAVGAGTSVSGHRIAASGASWTEVPVSKGVAKGVASVGVKLLVPKVRLFLLAQWSFECREGGDFESIMQALPNNGGVAMLGMPPSLAQASGSTGAAVWRAALDTGHVPLPHLTRDGEQTLAWYRGPLTPVGVRRETAGPYHSADQARRLDPATGLENLGYAAAFEIGRLMALGDPRFALDLMQWRRRWRLRLDQGLLNRILRVRIPGLDAFLAERLDPRHLLQLPRFLSQLSTDRLSALMRQGDLGLLRDPTGLSAVRDRLPGFNPAQVADAKGLSLETAQSLLGSLALGGSVLDEVGFVETPVLETRLDVLLENPNLHFGPQLQTFDNQLSNLLDRGRTR
ncbi:hypothetical protein [Hydrogenophaga sp.]|uniref:hypothetical protein n=1 Tax=Hydrogenophaga sp. TaxID=1904254 RepID=UPI0025C59CED|nr:hypothetical protein [Hydrogenophaga sp.]